MQRSQTESPKHRLLLALCTLGCGMKLAYAVLHKLKVYHAVVIPSLLYACETWTYVDRRHIGLLDNFHLSCLRRILRIKWQDKITNVEVLRRANTVGMEAFLMKAKLRWMGHVVRMGNNRLPKQVLYESSQNSTHLAVVV